MFSSKQKRTHDFGIHVECNVNNNRVGCVLRRMQSTMVMELLTVEDVMVKLTYLDDDVVIQYRNPTVSYSLETKLNLHVFVALLALITFFKSNKNPLITFRAGFNFVTFAVREN